MTKCKSKTLIMFIFLFCHCPRRAVVQVTCGTVRTWLPATPRDPPGSTSLTTSARSPSALWIRYQRPRHRSHHRRPPLRPTCPFIGSDQFSSVTGGMLCLCCGCVWWPYVAVVRCGCVCCLCVGVDHRRQGAGQPRSELWDGVPSAGSPAPGPQRTVLGLRHRGEGAGHSSYWLPLFFRVHTVMKNLEKSWNF